MIQTSGSIGTGASLTFSPSMNPAPDTLTFRVLVPDEFELVRPLWEQLGRHHAALPTPFATDIAARTFASHLSALRAKSGDGHLRIEVASAGLADAAPVGYCIDSITSDGAGEIDSLFVAPDHRRSGIATALLRRALTWLRASGAITRRVVTLHANTAAVEFYRRFGFHSRNIELEIPEDLPAEQQPLTTPNS